MSDGGAKPELLILASASPTRLRLLRDAGVAVIVDPPGLDEAAIKQEYRATDRDAGACALALAEAKARLVADRHPGALVLGADQILVAEERWFDKPADLDEARAHLFALRGRTHSLATAACVVRSGARLWHAISRPTLMMRSFGTSFLDDYIATEGEDLLGSVGAYRLEGRGVQLFARVEGDHHAILGLPLLPLLDFLRVQGVLAA